MKEFLDDLCRWSCDINGVQFASEIYQREKPDEYTREKFTQMQNSFMFWLANLDNSNRQRLAESVMRGIKSEFPRIVS